MTAVPGRPPVGRRASGPGGAGRASGTGGAGGTGGANLGHTARWVLHAFPFLCTAECAGTSISAPQWGQPKTQYARSAVPFDPPGLAGLTSVLFSAKAV